MLSQFPKYNVSDVTLSLLSCDPPSSAIAEMGCSFHGRRENETHLGVTMLGSSLMRLGTLLMCSRRERPGSMFGCIGRIKSGSNNIGSLTYVFLLIYLQSCLVLADKSHNVYFGIS